MKKMNIIAEQLKFSDEELILTNQSVLFWERKKTLILSDFHLGKAAHFRKNGIAVPTQVSVRDLQRLDHLIQHYNPEHVIIVGDLIHAGTNKEVELFRTLTVKSSQTHFILINGNHDRVLESTLMEIGIHEVYDELKVDGIHFIHKSSNDTKQPTISGHIHPGVRIRLPTGQNLRLPCYRITGNQIILPAFSAFTGLDTSSILSKGAICYAFSEDFIFRV